MSFDCRICNFRSKHKHHYDRHCETKKHLDNLKNCNMTECLNCHKMYSSRGGAYYNHLKKCQGSSNSMELQEYDNDMESIKYQLEMEKYRRQMELEKKDLETQLEKKDLEMELEKKNMEIQLLSEHLKIENQQLVPNNFEQGQYYYVHNAPPPSPTPRSKSKKEILNLHFDQVIDIDTFTENYKEKYGLLPKESEALYESYEYSGLKSYAPNIYACLRRSYIDQYRDLYGRDPSPEEIVLPFCASDSCMRQHFEKNEEGWYSTTSFDKIKKIIIISNDQVYKNNKKYILVTTNERTKISRDIVRINNYNSIVASNYKRINRIENQKVKL